MVKVKTSPENKTKVTLDDLNANIKNLTAALKGNAAVIKASANNIVSSSSSSSSSNGSGSSGFNDKGHSWYYNAGHEMWKSTSNVREPVGSTLIGGFTGINPALVQQLGIDKAIGSILKSTIGGIRKKWLAAGLGGESNSKKVNSAIESNKDSGVNKRLDKIIKLMGGNKKTKGEETKKEQGLFGKLLSFAGAIIGPLLKMAAWGALIAGISRAVNAIADWLGVLPKDVATTTAPVVSGVGHGLKNHANARKVEIQNEKIHRDALKEYMEDPYYKKMTPQQRAEARSKNGKLPKDAPKSFREKLEKVERTRSNLYDTEGITIKAARNAEIRAGKSATKLASGKITPKVTEPVKNTIRETGPKVENLAGKTLNAIGTGLVITDTAGNVIEDISEGNYGKAGTDTLRGGAWLAGMHYGGKYFSKFGKGWLRKAILGTGGAILGGFVGREGIEKLFPNYYQEQEALEDLAMTKPWHVRHPWGIPGSKEYEENELADISSNSYGKVPEWRNNQVGGLANWLLMRAEKYWPGWGGEEYYWDWANGNPTFTYGVTNQTLDPTWRAYVYAQGRLKRPMPYIPKSAYQGEIGYTHAKSAPDADFDYIYKLGLEDREKEIKRKKTEKLNNDINNYINATGQLPSTEDLQQFNQIKGLPTDFNTSSYSINSEEAKTSEIAKNTKDTNEYLRQIYEAVTDSKNTLRNQTLQDAVSDGYYDSKNASASTPPTTPPNQRTQTTD